jgi:hypothetical protein
MGAGVDAERAGMEMCGGSEGEARGGRIGCTRNYSTRHAAPAPTPAPPFPANPRLTVPLLRWRWRGILYDPAPTKTRLSFLLTNPKPLRFTSILWYLAVQRNANLCLQ